MSGFNYFTGELFGGIGIVMLVLIGTIIGICCCVKRKRDNDINYSVRKKLLGLQIGKFSNHDSFDDYEV